MNYWRFLSKFYCYIVIITLDDLLLSSNNNIMLITWQPKGEAIKEDEPLLLFLLVARHDFFIQREEDWLWKYYINIKGDDFCMSECQAQQNIMIVIPPGHFAYLWKHLYNWISNKSRLVHIKEIVKDRICSKWRELRKLMEKPRDKRIILWILRNFLHKKV